MRGKIKKLLILFIVIFMLPLTACGKKELVNISESKSKSVSLNNDIPKDGIIETSIFKKLMNSKEMAMFNGKNNEFSYQWMFIGSDIKKAEDINLIVNPEDKNLEEVKKQSKSDLVQGFTFKEQKEMNSNPSLSITLNKKWKCSLAEIYKYNESEKTMTKVSDATIEENESTIISFSVKDRSDKFYIVGSSPKEENINTDKKQVDKKINSKKSDKDLEENKNKTQEQKKKDSIEMKKQLGINMYRGIPNKDGKDKYLTDPIPEGKPKPVEWNESGNEVDKNKVEGYCTLSIRCDTLLKPENRKVAISNGKGEMIPNDGVIYPTKKVQFHKNESVFDVLLREVKANKIHMEFSMTPIYNSNYIEGIHNLYEFDGGELSGWMYKVNGWYPNYGCSRYQLKDGDVIEWNYTCDLGRDVGCEWMGGK